MGKGICSMELLEKLKLDLQGIELESFLELLVDLKVIVPVKTERNAFFIPSILSPCNEKDIFTEKDCGKPDAFGVDGQHICKDVVPLLIQFTFGTIPRGLFGFLIVQLIQDNPDTYELLDKSHHSLHPCADFICFYIKPCSYVFLRDRIFYLELQVRVVAEEPSYHYELQTTVTEALKKLCYEFNWPFGDCRYGFLCCEHKEYFQGEHLTLLKTNPPYADKIPQFACCDSRPTKLSEAHTIWFKDVKKNSKPPKKAKDTVTAASLPTNTTQSESETFNKKPEMIDLLNIVVPKIMTEWEYIAYALYYDHVTIKAIKEKERENPKKCCKEFFSDWLTTNNGAKAGPKVWSTLLNALKKVKDISADIVESIITEVEQLT